MATLTPHFKIKCSLEQGEFVRVAYTNFFEVHVPVKTPHMGEREKTVMK